MLRTPYLPGDSDMDQLKIIFRALGTPTEEDWPVSVPLSFVATSFSTRADRCNPAHNPDAVSQGHARLPDYVPVGQFPRTPLRDLFTAVSGDALNLLSRCLTYEPPRRIGAREVCLFLFENYVLHKFWSSTNLNRPCCTGPSSPLLYIASLPNTSI